MKDKSCRSCPSLLHAAEAPSTFRKNIGAPMCARFGFVLGKSGLKPAQENVLMEHFASSCDAHGEPKPPMPTYVSGSLQVMLPNPERRVAPRPGTPSVSTCATCKNFLAESKVASELGYLSGLCAAKGKLILPSRQAAEAKSCEFATLGPGEADFGGLHLLPIYDKAFTESGDLTAAYFKRKADFVDPRDYPSDKEVTDEEVEAGIRAWREVPDPEGSGNVAYLPIYNVDFFDAEEQAKIPKTNDDEHPELYVDHFGGVYLAAVAWTELDETPTLWGAPGTGKTELFRHLAWLMCLPFERISVTASSEYDELFGKTEYTPEKGTFFTNGRIPLAWGKPSVLCIDEPNTGPVDVWQAIRPMTDNSKQLIVNDVRLDRHTDCYLGFAMNPAWDARNIGALEIADADANRLFHAYVDLPNVKLEKEIIKARVHLDGWELHQDQLSMLMAVAKDLRALSDDGKLSVSWAIRPQIKVARALRWFTPVVAYRRAIADYLDIESQSIILDTVRSHTPE